MVRMPTPGVEGEAHAEHNGRPLDTHLDRDGLLRIVDWGRRWKDARGTASDFETLLVAMSERGTKMAHSTATGDGLVSNGTLGVDVIRVGAGSGFSPHTHPGDHLLIVVGGEGTITYQGRVYPTAAGQVYMVQGLEAHAVGALTDHVILAVGCPHKPVDATDRMAPTAYQSITTELGALHCLICDRKSVYPQQLHDAGCAHCPCLECVTHPETRPPGDPPPPGDPAGEDHQRAHQMGLYHGHHHADDHRYNEHGHEPRPPRRRPMPPDPAHA